MKRTVVAVLCLVVFAATLVFAQETKLSVAKDDTIRSVLAEQTGKRVTLKLDSGDELTGSVRGVGDRLVHLGELTGKEYFDAVVDLDEVAAVILRVR
jgi:hypothetical protein